MDSLNAMEVFVRVVQSGSFSEAARALNLTPSAVSKQVSRLEDRLGARLINRTTRRLGLTEEGQAFFERAQRILADVSEAEQAVTQLHGAPRGTLKLNAPVVFGRMHIAPHIGRFLARHPRVDLSLDLSDDFIDLTAQRVDLAIRITADLPPGLVAHRLATSRRVLCASPAYLAQAGEPRSIADLPWSVSYSSSLNNRTWFRPYQISHSGPPPTPAHASPPACAPAPPRSARPSGRE